MPAPSSDTRTRASPFARHVSMRTSPPGRLCFTALSTRFTITWRTRSRSASTTAPSPLAVTVTPFSAATAPRSAVTSSTKPRNARRRGNRSSRPSSARASVSRFSTVRAEQRRPAALVLGADLRSRRAQRAVEVGGQVGTQPRDHECSEAGDHHGEQQHVPRRQPDADRQPHSGSSVYPMPRTVFTSPRPNGCSSF